VTTNGEINLSDIWLFAGCSARELKSVQKLLEDVPAKAGRVLCKEGEYGSEFYLILEGSASVRRNNRKLAEVGPGQYFGELALLDRQPRSATVVADTDMRLLVLGRREFLGLVESVPSIARKMLAAMAVRLRDADTKAAALISH
jgi:CRP-like cAMP-binding protein